MGKSERPSLRVQCKATNRDGQRCRAWAIRGALVCRMHGGGAPQVKRAAEERMLVMKVNARYLPDINRAAPVSSIGEVYDELLAVAGQARAWRQIMSERVAELTEVGYAGKTGEQIKAEVILLERAMDRSAKIAELVARLNLDQRKAALDERTGEAVAEVIMKITAELGLTEEQEARLREAAPRHLRNLVG